MMVVNETSAEVEEQFTDEQNDPLTNLRRETSGKLVQGVKFPVSRFNPPRADARTEGI